MSYQLVRGIIILIFVIVMCIIWFVKPDKDLSSKRKKVWKYAPIVLCLLLVFLPFEYYFISFDTPLEALNYREHVDEILYIAETDNCAYVSYDYYNDQGKKTSLNTVIEKTSDKWRMRTNLLSREITYFKNDTVDVSGSVTYVPSCNKSFILVRQSWPEPTEPWEILDNYGQKYVYYRKIMGSVYFYTYYTAIEGLPPDDYAVIVNGETIPIVMS